MPSVHAQLAYRYLRGDNRRGVLSFTTWVSVIGMTLAVAATCLVTGVFNGFITKLGDVVIDKMGHFVLFHRESGITHVSDTVAKFKEWLPPGVELEAFGWTDAMAAGVGAGQGVNIEGVPDAAWSKLSKFVVEGDKDGARPAENGVWMGEALARALGVKAGQAVQLIVARSHDFTHGFIPRSRTFRVEKLISVGMHDYDGKIVIMRLPLMTEWLGWTAEANLLRVRLPSEDPKLFLKAQAALRENLPYPWVVKSWRELHRNFFDSIVIEKYFIAILVCVIVFISIFNVVSTLYLQVTEKVRDMSILRAMGASKKFLHRVFLWNGAFFGAMGATCGVMLASILCVVLRIFPIIKLPRDIYNLSRLPIEVRWHEWAAVWLLTVVTALLSSYFPARRAGQLQPVDGLRYE